MDKSRARSVKVHFLICTIINIFCLFTLLFTLIYRQIVIWYLKWKYGDNFAEMMTYADFISVFSTSPQAPTNPLIFFEVESNNYDENGVDPTLCEDIKNRFESFIFTQKHLIKFTYTWHRALGYGFYKKNDKFDISKHIRRLELRDGQTIEDFVNEAYKLKFPYNDTSTWEILVVDQADASGRKGSPRKYYGLIRFCHCLTDGLSLVQVLGSSIFRSDTPGTPQPEVPEKIINMKNPLSVWQRALILWKWPEGCIRNTYQRTRTSIFHPLVLSGKKNMVWHRGKGDEIKKVKSVKNSIPGTAFSNVICTAISVALYKYVIKYKGKEHLPDFLYGVRSSVLPSTDVSFEPKVFKAQNAFTSEPLYLKLISPELTTREKISHISEDLIDYEMGEPMAVNQGITFFFDSFPLGWFPQVTKIRFEVAITNLPSFSNGSLCGRPVIHKFAGLNNVLNIGASFCLISYDNKLDICFFADEAVIPNREQAQEILDNVAKEIDNMYYSLAGKEK